MQLTLKSDYALRTLIYLAAHQGELVTVRQIAEAYRISAHHLVKVAQALGEIGCIELVRGRGGGIRLKQAPEEIIVGQVVRRTEPTLELVECFNKSTNTCVIAPGCGLKGVLIQAQEAFLTTLDRYTLADLTRNRAALRKLLQQPVS